MLDLTLFEALKEALDARGVLGGIRAQLRAEVFAAINENVIRLSALLMTDAARTSVQRKYDS